MAQTHTASTPTTEQIREQRDRILASKVFALSKRLRAFLTFIINAQLEDRPDNLKEFTLGIDVFDKDETFDPSIDSIVRVEASRLRSKLREYYDGEGQDDPVRIDIPKGHYVPVFRLTGQDRGSEALNQEHNVDRSRSIADVTGRQLGFTVFGLMAVFIIYLVVDDYVLEQAPQSPTRDISDKSIAVLPFVPMSSGEDDGYFADGLTEEILNSLAQLPELQVTARTSSFYFKGQDLLMPEIAARLGVAHVVEGSVRRDGNRLRIVAQLIRASDDNQLWSQTYDRTRDDIFAVQEDIAENIAEVLGVVLDDAAREIMRSAGIGNVDAFIAYQKGREAYVTAHGGMRMSDGLVIANSHFERALEVAPGLTMARLMKADLPGHIIFDIAAGIRDENYPGELQETLAELREEYSLAINLSPAGNQRALLDLERSLFSEDWTELPGRIEKAMQPGGCPQMNWTIFIAYFGWADHLVTKFREAIKCNPLDTGASYQLPWSLIWSGDFDAALQAIQDAEKKGLSHPFLEDGRFWALLAAGRIDDPATRGPGPDGGNMTYNRQILREAVAGNHEVARQMANDYLAGLDTDDLSTLIITAVTGDRERANQVAARIDAHPGSAAVLSSAILTCFCGAPFDLDATPNYKERVDEAGLPWPPPKRIGFLAKTW